jgi:hypothetical protein
MIRTVLLFALLILIPLALIAGGLHGIITGHVVYKRTHIDGISARVLSSVAVLFGLAVLRAYWMVIRGPAFEPEGLVMRALLVLAALALVAGLVLMAFSIAF